MTTLSKKEFKTTVKEIIAPFEKAVNKRFNAIDKRFESIDKRFQEIDKRFESIDKRFQEIDKRFESIDKRFQEIDKRFDTIDKRLDKLESHMIMIDTRLASVEADVKWMKENSSAIFTRIDRFIALYEHHDQEFKILDAQVSERFENLERRVAQLETAQ